MVAVMFLGFFAFSNYYLGFLSFSTPFSDEVTDIYRKEPGSIIKPTKQNKEELDLDIEYQKLQDWKMEIEIQNQQNIKIREALKDGKDHTRRVATAAPSGAQLIDKDHAQQVATAAPSGAQLINQPIKDAGKVEAQEQGSDAEEEKARREREAKCHYKRDRDYEENPIVVIGRFNGVW
jgi:hypothetical protein